MIKKTKVIGLVLVSLFVGNTLTSCGSTNEKNEEETTIESTDNEVALDEKVAEPEAKSTEQGGKTVYLTTAEFKEKVFDFDKNKDWKYEGTKPCIIDFYADWCGPCKKIAPILDELAAQYKDDIIIYKIDTEKERELAQAFGIKSIPTLLFIPANGQPQMVQGALPKESFEEAIKDVLLKK